MTEDSTKNFERALSFTFGSEGGYSDHPADRGGKTNMGITAGTLARAYENGLVRCCDICKLSRADAAKIYKAYYWEASYADEMPWPLCALHFDAAVNHGLGGAARLLQKTLNHFAAIKLKVDGATGPATRMEMHRQINNCNQQSLKRICTVYLDEREALFRRIAVNNPSQKVFLRGWLNRVEKNRKLANTAFA